MAPKRIKPFKKRYPYLVPKKKGCIQQIFGCFVLTAFFVVSLFGWPG